MEQIGFQIKVDLFLITTLGKWKQFYPDISELNILSAGVLRCFI